MDALERVTRSLNERRRSLATVLVAVACVLAWVVRFRIDVPLTGIALVMLLTCIFILGIRLLLPAERPSRSLSNRRGEASQIAEGVAKHGVDACRAAVRGIRIEDLLGREPVDLHLPELAEDLAGCVVLITGAAGSIGSELARQVALHSPRALVILDQAETPLFFLDLELREAHPGLTIHPVVCDIVDAAGIEEVFARFRPDRVFHAAAYKHVPMMEFNTREAFRNNVIGSLRVADAAGRFGARRFVLVSTDKAVRPANAMGTSKRFAEILTLECQEQHPRTSYSAVRFGNVLGTAGSVLQVFERQIEQGRPLTVTHPEATRYFMTVQEAVHLILHASVLNECQNRIVVLDMGEPVKILDMARRLLCHAGVVDVSSRITFIGLRPGEKLHEELIGPGEVMERTPVSRIRVVKTVRQRRGVSQRPLTLSGVTGRLDVNRSSRGVAWM